MASVNYAPGRGLSVRPATTMSSLEAARGSRGNPRKIGGTAALAAATRFSGEDQAPPTNTTVSSDYASYGKPWLKAAAVPSHGPYSNPLVPGTNSIAQYPKYTQGREPKEATSSSNFFRSPADSRTSAAAAVATSTCSLPATSGGYDPEVYVRGIGQAPGVARPGPVVRAQQPSQVHTASNTGKARGAPRNRTDSTVTQDQGNHRNDGGSGSTLTSDHVRDAVFNKWLESKAAAKTKALAGHGTGTSKHSHAGKGLSKGKKSTGKVAQRVLTPEQLFQDSNHVRQAAYEEWMAKKLGESREKKHAENEAKSQLSASAELEKKQKEVDAQQAFEAWKAQKQERQAQKNEKAKKAEREEKEQKERDAREKQDNAESAFRAWKAPKDDKLKDSVLQKRQKEKELAERTREEQDDKLKSSQSAFDGWKSKKRRKTARGDQATTTTGG
eukprot:scpid65913/ scgid35449/ 